MSELLGWHCSTGRLGYGDGREIRAGITHHVDGPLEMCRHGLHASVRPLDALQYAPADATVIARVRLHGEIQQGDDKCVATDRTYLRVLPMRPILDEFACCCAEAALMIGDVTDERCWQAIHIKREWLAGRATDADLAAARDAAWAAAWAAARDAAWAAAWDAAWAAAWDAAWAAARDAAWAAAWDAARDAARAAARDAAWDEINDLLESMLLDAIGEAHD